MDFADREPFGFPIRDTQMSMLMSIIANTAGAQTTMDQFSLAAKLHEEDEVAGQADLVSTLKAIFPPKKSPPAGEGSGYGETRLPDR